jgi:hypothetical protein
MILLEERKPQEIISTISTLFQRGTSKPTKQSSRNLSNTLNAKMITIRPDITQGPLLVGRKLNRLGWLRKDNQ